MTSLDLPALTVEEAQRLTVEVRGAGERLWELMELAKATEVWVVLGRASWEEWLALDVGISRRWANRLLAHAGTVRAIEQAAGGPIPPMTPRATEAISDRQDEVTAEVAQRVQSGEPAERVVAEVVAAHSRGTHGSPSRSEGVALGYVKLSEQLTLDLGGHIAAVLDAEVEAFAKATDAPSRRRLRRLLDEADRLDRPPPHASGGGPYMTVADCPHPIGRRLGKACGQCGKDPA